MVDHPISFVVCWICCSTLPLRFIYVAGFRFAQLIYDRFPYYITRVSRGGTKLLAVLATVVIAFFLSEWVGFSVHRLAHWPGSGWLFRNHLRHHAEAYPPSRYQTERYLGDLKTSFLRIFVPLFVGLNVLAWIVLPWHLATIFFVTSSATALANSYLHDSYHMNDHWLRRFGWHRRLVDTHYVHHLNVKKNLGIYFLRVRSALRIFQDFFRSCARRSFAFSLDFFSVEGVTSAVSASTTCPIFELRSRLTYETTSKCSRPSFVRRLIRTL